MKSVITALLLLCIVASAEAQSRLSGRVVDFSTGRAIDYATIAVADMTTDKILDGATADSSGAFVIGGLPSGSYKLSVSFLGYNTYNMDSVVLTNSLSKVKLPVIRLKSSGQTLQEVTVTGTAPILENKIDKIVYNAENDVTAQGGVALDVLKKVPQVSVDVDGNVELQGRSGIRFLINGRPSSIFGSSLADALASIPASQIKSIEAITTPGAKYDAQGTAGIINIILKDNKMKGVNGSINLSAGTRRENASVNLNFRSGNFGVNAFFSGNAALKAKSPSSQDRTSYNTTDQTTTQMLQDGYSDIKRNGIESGIGLDWNASKADAFTASFQYNDFNSQRNGIVDQQESVFDAWNNPIGTTNSQRYSRNSSSEQAFDWSLDYKHKFKRDGEEIELNYNASNGRPVMDYSQYQIYSGAAIPFAGSASTNPGVDDQTNIQLDYVRPLGKKSVLEAGAKSVFQHFRSVADVSTLSASSGDYIYDVLQSYTLNYKMNVYAGYVSATFPLANFLNVKAGLRMEHTDIALDYGNTQIPSYNILAPTIILSHNIGEKQFIKLAYARRIERPDYEELNPFLNLSDPYNITTGNPQLKPEYGNNFELGYNRSFENGANFYVAISERLNTQDIKPFTAFHPYYTIGDSVYQNVSITNRQNIGEEYNTGLIITGSVPVIKALTVRGNLMMFNRHILNNLDSVNKITNGFNARLNMNLSYTMPKDLIAEAFGNYQSGFKNIQGRNPHFFTYTLAFRKQFWSKKASAGLTATNFMSNYVRQVTTIHTSTYDAYNVRQLPFRSFGVTFTYKFGKLEFNNDKVHDKGFMNGPSDN